MPAAVRMAARVHEQQALRGPRRGARRSQGPADGVWRIRASRQWKKRGEGGRCSHAPAHRRRLLAVVQGSRPTLTTRHCQFECQLTYLPHTSPSQEWRKCGEAWMREGGFCRCEACAGPAAAGRPLRWLQPPAVRRSKRDAWTRGGGFCSAHALLAPATYYHWHSTIRAAWCMPWTGCQAARTGLGKARPCAAGPCGATRQPHAMPLVPAFWPSCRWE